MPRFKKVSLEGLPPVRGEKFIECFVPEPPSVEATVRLQHDGLDVYLPFNLSTATFPSWRSGLSEEAKNMGPQIMLALESAEKPKEPEIPFSQSVEQVMNRVFATALEAEKQSKAAMAPSKSVVTATGRLVPRDVAVSVGDMTRTYFRVCHLMSRMVDACRAKDKKQLIDLSDRFSDSANEWAEGLYEMAGVTKDDVANAYLDMLSQSKPPAPAPAATAAPAAPAPPATSAPTAAPAAPAPFATSAVSMGILQSASEDPSSSQAPFASEASSQLPTSVASVITFLDLVMERFLGSGETRETWEQRIRDGWVLFGPSVVKDPNCVCHLAGEGRVWVENGDESHRGYMGPVTAIVYGETVTAIAK